MFIIAIGTWREIVRNDWILLFALSKRYAKSDERTKERKKKQIFSRNICSFVYSFSHKSDRRSSENRFLSCLQFVNYELREIHIIISWSLYTLRRIHNNKHVYTRLQLNSWHWDCPYPFHARISFESVFIDIWLHFNRWINQFITFTKPTHTHSLNTRI